MDKFRTIRTIIASSPRTSVVGIVWVGYGIAELALTKTITEFGFLAMLTGLGFLAAGDSKKKKKKDVNQNQVK